MVRQVTYERMRGQTCVFAMIDADAAEGEEAKIACAIAPLSPGARMLDQATPASATLTIEFRDATDDVPAGWNAILSAEASAALSGGTSYQLDAKRTDGTIVTAIAVPARLFIREPAFS